MTTQYVQEIDVNIAVAKWLHSNGWQLERISMPHGRGIDSIRNKAKLEAEFTAVGISISNIEFRPTGEDIRARKDGILWRIECKSLGADLPSSTVRSQFDRALSSTVSNYNQRGRLRLGLALPEEYNKLVRGRVPQALREAINLWILLYVSADDEVVVFAPEEEIPL